MFKDAKFGAYSELYTGFSPAIKFKDNGGFNIPWGRPGKLPDHIVPGLKTKEEGGTGLSKAFWSWCLKETAPYL